MPGLLGAGLIFFANAMCAEHFNIQAHDPVMIRQDGTFYVFCTGNGISVYSSKDMKNCHAEKPVFAELPKWAAQRYAKARNNEWAPDIAFHEGIYYLYYAVSSFGSNNPLLEWPTLPSSPAKC